jgi:transcriptional regulator with XRE-family HTH domain
VNIGAHLRAKDAKPWPGRIRARRAQLGLTTGELARKLGTNPGVVARWESGVTDPSLPSMAAIARALGTTPDYVMGFREVP